MTKNASGKSGHIACSMKNTFQRHFLQGIQLTLWKDDNCDKRHELP